MYKRNRNTDNKTVLTKKKNMLRFKSFTIFVLSIINWIWFFRKTNRGDDSKQNKKRTNKQKKYTFYFKKQRDRERYKKLN